MSWPFFTLQIPTDKILVRTEMRNASLTRTHRNLKILECKEIESPVIM